MRKDFGTIHVENRRNSPWLKNCTVGNGLYSVMDTTNNKLRMRTTSAHSTNNMSLDPHANIDHHLLDYVAKLEQELKSFQMRKKELEACLSYQAIGSCASHSLECRAQDELEHTDKMICFLQLELENATHLATIDRRESIQVHFLEKQMELLKKTKSKIIQGKNLIDHIHLIKQLTDDNERLIRENEVMKQKVRLVELYEQELLKAHENTVLEKYCPGLSLSGQQKQSSDSCTRIARLLGTMEQLEKELNLERQTRKEMEALYEKLAFMYKELRKTMKQPKREEPARQDTEKDDTIRLMRAKIILLEEERNYYAQNATGSVGSQPTNIPSSNTTNQQNSKPYNHKTPSPPPPPPIPPAIIDKVSKTKQGCGRQPTEIPKDQKEEQQTPPYNHLRACTNTSSDEEFKNLIQKTKQSLRSVARSLTSKTDE